MKKSVEILGLPIISITEGRELGLSKTLLIDAKNGTVAAITIEDDDWYRGVKLIPYESIIAIGEDAITITHSENILKLDEAGDYERLLVENVRVIGTKAITKAGRIQGVVSEVFIGDGGRIEQCEITAPDGSVSSVAAAQISIFGKQVTVVSLDDEKKNSLTRDLPAFEPAYTAFNFEPAQEIQPTVETVETVEEIQPTVEAVETVEEIQPTVEAVEPVEEIQPTVEAVEPVEEIQPTVEVAEPVEDVQPTVEVAETVEDVQPTVEVVESVEDVQPTVEVVETVEEIQPTVEVAESVEEIQPTVEVAETVEDDQKLASITRQAADLKAALQKAKAGKKKSTDSTLPLSQKSQVERAVDERRRRVLLGKHATKSIITDNGITVVEAGAEVTEEVLQRARLANKFIELSMNVQ